MKITIIICTYNRATNLPECFEHLEAQQEVEHLSWEVVLVDNNSSDQTRELCESYSAQSPLNIRYVFEQQQGLSYARNRGINEAKGEYLVFIDDDIRVTPRWLAVISETFATQGCDVVGGRIEIQSPEALPRWITPDMYGFLGHQDFGEHSHPMDGYREFPFGGNMAVKRSVFEQVGLFDTALGRKGEGSKPEELFKGEETDFFHRVADAGGSFYYHPEAAVLHKILPYQLEKKFFLTLHRNAGELKAQLDHAKHSRRVMNVPLFVFPQYVRSVSVYLKHILRDGKISSFRKRMNISYFAGMIRGYQKARSRAQ